MRLFFAIIIAMNSAFILTDGAEFSFLDPTNHKFEDTKEGVLLSHTFRFKNSGDEPLIISNYKVSCSCTKLTFPKQPVLPGQEAQLKLTFDTNGKYGFQKRKVNVVSNAKKQITLLFKVTVIPKDA